jgi:hypothetical protein
MQGQIARQELSLEEIALKVVAVRSQLYYRPRTAIGCDGIDNPSHSSGDFIFMLPGFYSAIF